jgi:hypothetical protein
MHLDTLQRLRLLVVVVIVVVVVAFICVRRTLPA